MDVLLLVFASILLALFLRGLSDWVGRHTPLSGGWALASVALVIVAVVGLGAWLLAPDIAAQVDELSERLPRAAERIRGQLARYGWGRRMIEQLPGAEDLMPDRADVLARATGVFSITLGLIANFVIIIFVGIYLAASPEHYTRGALRLVPPARRQRARGVLSALGATLRGWLLGKVITMLIVGVLTTAGLWLLGMPLALTLGLIATLLAFIPNIGPVLSVVPAVLLALVEGPRLALYVVLLYVGVQSVESYLLNPLVYKRTVSLSPALTIAAQVLMGVLFGIAGLALATPLTAAAVVLVKMLYVEDVLGDTADVPEAGGDPEGG